MHKYCDACGTQELRLSPSGCLGFGRLCPHYFAQTEDHEKCPYYNISLSDNPVFRQWIHEYLIPARDWVLDMIALENEKRRPHFLSGKRQ